MGIACITVTHNDHHLLENWKKYYSIYKAEIDIHIIVDNASSGDFVAVLKTIFPESDIIERKENGGTTAGFNDGIKYILTNSEIDSIILLCPDICMEKGAISKLRSLLTSDESIGIVGPLLLKKGHSDLIESYGGELSKHLRPKLLFNSLPINNHLPGTIEVSFIPGGINMIKTEVFRRVGLQDETLFMYGDEVDFDLRAMNAGYRLVVTKDALAWHEHIISPANPSAQQFVIFLSSRNLLRLCKKHLTGYSLLIGFLSYMYHSFYITLGYLKERNFSKIQAHHKGIIYGIFNINRFPGKWGT
jgi:GT2 family glycosyltransferase